MNSEKNIRMEHDLLGAREIPADALYGIQTLRGVENFSISKFKLSQYPLFINGLAYTKWAAAEANHQLGLLTDAQYEGIKAACQDILAGKYHDQFPVDMIQGGSWENAVSDNTKGTNYTPDVRYTPPPPDEGEEA